MPQATKGRALPRPAHAEIGDALTDVLVSLKRRADPDSAARAFLLGHVDKHAPVRATDLAEHVGLDLSTVSRHLKVLEDHGLVVRTPDPDDRRAALLALSPEGRDALTRARLARTDALAHATSTWTDTDLTALADLLTRLADDLENL